MSLRDPSYCQKLDQDHVQVNTAVEPAGRAPGESTVLGWRWFGTENVPRLSSPVLEVWPLATGVGEEGNARMICSVIQCTSFRHSSSACQVLCHRNTGPSKGPSPDHGPVLNFVGLDGRFFLVAAAQEVEDEQLRQQRRPRFQQSPPELRVTQQR